MHGYKADSKIFKRSLGSVSHLSIRRPRERDLKPCKWDILLCAVHVRFAKPTADQRDCTIRIDLRKRLTLALWPVEW